MKEGKSVELEPLRKLDAKVDKMIEILESRENKPSPSDDGKILEQYPKETVSKFWNSLDSTSEGLKRSDIEKIFGIRKSQAYTLIDRIHKDYDNIELRPHSGNRPKKLVKKKKVLLKTIKEDLDGLADKYYEKKEKGIASEDWESILEIYRKAIEQKEGNTIYEALEARFKDLKEICGKESP